jgi:ubiquitin-conjugating enzyme E2 J1
MQGGEALSAIGALDQSKEERRRLAKLYVFVTSPNPSRGGHGLMSRSKDWECPQCGKMRDQIPESASAPVENDGPSRVDAEDHEAKVNSAVTEQKDALLEAANTSETPVVTPPRPPTPPTEIIPEEVRPPPTPTPTVPMPQQVRQQIQPDHPRQAPMWIDGLIVAGVCILVTMLYRKIGNSSNLIETVSL